MKKTNIDNFEKELDYIKFHLIYYGNNAFFKDPAKHIEELKKEGFDISVRYVPTHTVRHVSGSLPDEDQTIEEMWILELKNRRK